MKKIGILGGVAWISTVDYYSQICRLSEQRHLARHFPGPPSTPKMTIESLDLNQAVSYLGREGDEGSWAQFDEYHRAGLRRLEAAGADFALMASNTPHHRFESIVKGVHIPVLDMFNVVARESSRLAAKQVVILGTALTMSSRRFRDTFAKQGIEAAGPEDTAARNMTVQLIDDLQLGRRAGADERLRAIAKTSAARRLKSQPLICLACTELPLAFPELKSSSSFEDDGILYLNTAVAHANAAFDYAAN